LRVIGRLINRDSRSDLLGARFVRTNTQSTIWSLLLPAAGGLGILLFGACTRAAPDSPFSGQVEELTAAEAAALETGFANLFPLSADGLRFEDELCGDVNPEVKPVDLDGDGDQEVFVQWGNGCTSGLAGTSVSLFIMDSDGTYRDQFGFPGMVSRVLDGEPGRYPDIEVGGPGFCFGIWAWDGEAYAFRCNAPQAEGGCEFEGKVCPLPN
jgi:hypothetical protein